MSIIDKIITNVNVSIAGIRISFWTNHPADKKCLEDLLFYHLDRDEASSGIDGCHDVFILSAKEKFSIPLNMPLIWTGFVNQNVPVCWYNSINKEENIIVIAEDILIRHFPERKLTVCCLTETKGRFSKSHRPSLTNYIFFLLQSILSMHGKYCLHASCVSKNEKAYLFLGKSGEGKSTMSAILGKAGFEYMGDDLVFISGNELGEIVANAFLTKIKLDNSKSKIKDSIDVIKDNHFKYAYQNKLGAIINLQRTYVGKESVLVPATQMESFAWLMNSGNNIKIQYHQQLWMSICEQASLLPSFTLMFADKEYFEPDILDAVLK